MPAPRVANNTLYLKDTSRFHPSVLRHCMHGRLHCDVCIHLYPYPAGLPLGKTHALSVNRIPKSAPCDAVEVQSLWPVVNGAMKKTDWDGVEIDPRLKLLGALVIMIIAMYCHLFIHYFALTIMFMVFAPKWDEAKDEVATWVGRRGDTLFFPLLVMTNLLYCAAAVVIRYNTVMVIIGMILEGASSAFNWARLGVILSKKNKERRFNILEVIIETILIEIAPVTLMAWYFGIEKELDEWDMYGMYGLIPLAFLLSTDFNTRGAKDNQLNFMIFVEQIVTFLQWLWENLFNIMKVVTILVLALTVPRAAHERGMRMAHGRGA